MNAKVKIGDPELYHTMRYARYDPYPGIPFEEPGPSRSTSRYYQLQAALICIAMALLLFFVSTEAKAREPGLSPQAAGFIVVFPLIVQDIRQALANREQQNDSQQTDAVADRHHAPDVRRLGDPADDLDRGVHEDVVGGVQE